VWKVLWSLGAARHKMDMENNQTTQNPQNQTIKPNMEEFEKLA
jgi:hypothetical protein